MQLILHGTHRYALAERARAVRIAQLGQAGYLQHLQQCRIADRAQAIATARSRVAELTRDVDGWLTALCILYELQALPDPLVLTLAPGITQLPVPELPEGVRHGR